MCSESIREAEFTKEKSKHLYHKYDLQPMNLYFWIKIHSKCKGERETYILSLSRFSCVYTIRFPPVALLLSSCSTLSPFIMLCIVIFICLQVSNNFYFPPLLICCKPPRSSLSLPACVFSSYFLQLSQRPVHSFSFLPPLSCPFSHLLVWSSTVWD